MVDAQMKGLTKAREQNKRQHYFLVAGEVMFHLPAKAGQAESEAAVAHVNTVGTTHDGRIPLVAIGRLQQQLQMQLYKEIGEPDLRIVKVCILSIVPLGQFTAEEFNATPDKTRLAEMSLALN